MYMNGPCALLHSTPHTHAHNEWIEMRDGRSHATRSCFQRSCHHQVSHAILVGEPARPQRVASVPPDHVVVIEVG